MKILEKGEKAIEDLQFKAKAYFIPFQEKSCIIHFTFIFLNFTLPTSILFVQYSFSRTKYKLSFALKIYTNDHLQKIFKFRKEKIERLSFTFFYPIR